MSGSPWATVPPEPAEIRIGDQVEAAFRLFDVLPFGVRQDLARLIFLYMHDPEGYDAKKRDVFPAAPALPGAPIRGHE